jgi:hypothetical protein
MTTAVATETASLPKQKTTLVDKLGKSLIDTTMICGSTNAIYATLEVTKYGMSHADSTNTRLGVYATSLLGLGRFYSWTQGKSREFFGVEKEGMRQAVHDAAYGATFGFVTAPPFYHFLGQVPWDATLKPAVGAAVLNIGLGPLMGAAINIGRDLAFDESSRYVPDAISESNRTRKFVTLVALIGAMYAANAVVYEIFPDKETSAAVQRAK